MASISVSTNQDRVIVVGGGLAGLAAATYLARGQRSVTLLEKAPELGGRAASDSPSGFALNRGGHALYPGGSASDVLAELGVEYGSGNPRNVFALSSTGFHALPTNAGSLLRTDLFTGAEKRELTGVFLRLAVLRPSTLASISVAEWVNANARRRPVRQLLEALARVYVFSSALDAISADVFVAQLQQSTRHAVQYVDGGWRTLVQGFSRAAREAGVQINAGASVAEVLVRDELAYGVRLHDGAELACNEVVLAVTPDDAVRLLGDQSDSPLAQMVRASLPAYVACLDIALERLPVPAHPVVFDLDDANFMSAQSAFARLAPDGGAVIHALRQLDPRQHSDPHADRAELEAFLDRAQTGWRAAVVECRYLPRMQAAGTTPLVAHGGLAGRAPYRSQTATNVYFAGDWVGPHGYLLDASLDSARESARLILRNQALAAARAA